MLTRARELRLTTECADIEREATAVITACSKCGQPAVYLRRYTSESLCRACLVRTTDERVRRTINKNKMLRDDDRVAVGVSGGKDSAVLLDVLVRIEREYPEAEIVPFTVDEGISGYRDRALEMADRLSRSLGLALQVCTFKDLFGISLDEIVQMRGRNGLGACSYCGVLRRRAMNEMAHRLDADVIATGHNLDDEAQTVIMNVMRGDGRRIGRTNRHREHAIRGFVPRIKPVSELSERDIVAYAHYMELPYHDVPCPYAGEAFRNDIRLFLNRMEHRRPGTLLAIVHSAEDLVQALQQDSMTEEPQTCERCGEPSMTVLCKVCEMLEDLGEGRGLHD